MTIRIKRIYEAPSKADGWRVLVDRLWPRGVKKEAAELDAWVKDVAPSSELRQWFDHKPEKFDAFRKKYRYELGNNPAVKELREKAQRHTVTLLYAAKDPAINHAVVLQEYLTKDV